MPTTPIDLVLRMHDRASRPMQRALRRMVRNVANVRTALGGLIGVGALAHLTRSTIEWGDQLAKTADKVGLSTATLQELRYAAERSGVETRTLDMAMQRFSRRVAEAAQGAGELKGVLEQYDIQVTNADGSTRALEAVFGDLADAMAGAGSEQEQLRMAFKAFDSEGAALVNMMRNGSAGVDQLRGRFRALGLVVKDENLRQFEKTQDALTDLAQVMKGRLHAAVSDLAPDIKSLVDDLTAWVGQVDLAGWARGAAEFVRDLSPVIGSIARDFAGMLDVFKDMPDWMKPLGLVAGLIGGRFSAIAMGVGLAIKHGVDAGFMWMQEKSYEATHADNPYGYSSWQSPIQPPPLADTGPDPTQDYSLGTLSHSMPRPPSVPGADATGPGEDIYALQEQRHFEFAARWAQTERDLKDQSKSGWQAWADDVLAVWSDVGGALAGIFDQVVTGMGQAVAQAIIYGASFADAMQRAIKAVAAQLVASLVKWVAAYVVNAILSIQTATTEMAARVAASSAITYASAVASTVGALGPGALVYASGITAAMNTGAAGAYASAMGLFAGLGGGAHGGMDYIPKETTLTVDRGERIVSPEQNEDLTDFLRGRGGAGGRAPVVLQIDGREFGRIIGDLQASGRLALGVA